VHFRLVCARLAAADPFRLVAVVQHFEADKLVDVVRGERGLIELDPELLHPNCRYVDHRRPVPSPRKTARPHKSSDFTEQRRLISTVFATRSAGRGRDCTPEIAVTSSGTRDSGQTAQARTGCGTVLFRRR